MPNFNNTEIAFRSKSNAELKNAYVLFKVIGHPWLVKCIKLATNIALKIGFPLAWAVKPTLYKQFVGGETLSECIPTIENLHKFKILSTLDFSAEGEQTPEGIRAAFDETLRSIDFAKDNDKLAYAVFKPSTLINDHILCKASESPEQLTDEDRHELDEFRKRFMSLCQRAFDNGVRILVDAEEYCFQKIIDEATDDAMSRFNKERAIVFATLQMYRHDRMPYLEQILSNAKEKGHIAGVKFVRGAYMDDERTRAAVMGYHDPICKDKQATDDNYNAAIRFTIDNIDSMELFMGTHNEQSNYLLARLIEERGIARNDRRIFFAQLLGMSDNISFNLSDEGYNVTKYVPYASVSDVLPYLLRRAEENTFVAGHTGRELSIIKTELIRRKTAHRRG